MHVASDWSIGLMAQQQNGRLRGQTKNGFPSFIHYMFRLLFDLVHVKCVKKKVISL